MPDRPDLAEDPRDGGRAVDTDLLREVNRRIYEVTLGFEGPSEFVCECGQDGCEEKLMLRTAEFIEVLTARRRLVAPDHTADRSPSERLLAACDDNAEQMASVQRMLDERDREAAAGA